MSATPEAESDYLSPEFDPNSVTIPRLRSILVTHDVSYPASAKKSQLVDIFNDSVAPQARKLLTARSRTKRSTRGITDVPSSNASIAEEDEDLMSPLRETPRPRGARRSTRQSTVDSDLAPARNSRPGTSASAATTTDLSSPRKRSSGGRAARASMTPSIKQEDEEPASWHREADDSPFSRDNPFQRASIGPNDELPGNRRRTLAGAGENAEKRKSSGTSRRKTENYSRAKSSEETGRRVSKVQAVVPVHEDLETATEDDVTDEELAEELEEDLDDEEYGEEFTLEEQQELALAEANDMALVRARRRKAPRGSGAWKTAPLAVLFAMFGGLFTVWRQEKIEVGYCGIGREPSTELGGIQIPEWAVAIQPQCEPCPSHAICYPDLQTKCQSDFVLQPHQFAMGGLVPLPPTCEPDSEKARRVKTVADRAVEELRQRAAKFECGELVDDKGKKATTPELSEEELKTEVAAKRRKGMSQEEFEDLWRGAIGDILSREEVVLGDKDGSSSGLRSTSLARLPLRCALRRSVRLTLARYLWQLVALGLLLLSSIYARYSIVVSRSDEDKAKRLAAIALDRLATQKVIAKESLTNSPTGADPNEENFLPVAQLRDDVLRSEFSTFRRKRLWDRVQRKVESNSNVRSMVRTNQLGDVGRVWEWVGATRSLEDERRRSGLSFITNTSTPDNSDRRLLDSPAGQQQREEMGEVRKWDESRPIY